MSKYKYTDGQKVAFVYGGIEGYGIVRGVSTTELPILGCFYIIEVLTSIQNFPNDEYPFKAITVPELHLEYIRLSDQSDLLSKTEIRSVYTDSDLLGTKTKIKMEYLRALQMMPEPERSMHAEQWAKSIHKGSAFPSNLTLKHLHQFIRYIVGVK